LARLIFFLLIIANAAFALHLWLTGTGEVTDFSNRERNRDEVKLVAVTPPVIAARKAEETRETVARLQGSACVEFAGVASADLPRAREAFAAFKLGDRLLERRVEDITRHWVFMPAARDRKTAEATMAELRKKNVGDMSIRPDNTVSLGVFSTEEAARRYLTAMEAKGVRGAQSGPFTRELREIAFLVREPDTEMVARLAILQRDYNGALIRAVPCPNT
jgi:hypothetical protein